MAAITALADQVNSVKASQLNKAAAVQSDNMTVHVEPEHSSHHTSTKLWKETHVDFQSSLIFLEKAVAP